MTIHSRLRVGRLAALGFIAFSSMFLGVVQASAQDGACIQDIELAERYYEQSRMQEVVGLVTDCLSNNATDDATAVRGYRLLALAYLRSDQVGEAKLAVIELLGRNPAYETDPIQDLPAYTALVNNIKVQLALQGNDVRANPKSDSVTTIVEPGLMDPSDSDYRPQDRILLSDGNTSASSIELRLRIGWSSYGGERGDTGNGFFDEYTDNGGVGFGAELGFGVSEYFVLGFQYQLGHYDTMLSPKGTAPDFPEINIGTSSPWLHYIGVMARGYAPTGGPVKPYAQLGYLATLGLLNDKVSVGSGPKVAIGLDISVDDSFGLYVEVEGQAVLPGTAVDLVDQNIGYDLFSAAGVGLRYRISK